MIDQETGEIVVGEQGMLEMMTSRKPFVRSRYNYSMDAVSRETGEVNVEPTLAQQQFKEECDINTIVRNFGVTGQLPNNVRVPLMDEFIDVMDYQSALNLIMESERAFMEVPAEIRESFQNDAGKFVAFVSDEANVEQCRKWGLALPKAGTGSSEAAMGGAAPIPPADKP